MNKDLLNLQSGQGSFYKYGGSPLRMQLCQPEETVELPTG